MLTIANVYNWTEVMTDPRFAVPERTARVSKASSFRKIPKSSAVEAYAGRPSNVTVIGATRDWNISITPKYWILSMPLSMGHPQNKIAISTFTENVLKKTGEIKIVNRPHYLFKSQTKR